MTRLDVVESVGVLGLGRMGLPVARHLSSSGFAVTGYDTADEARRQALTADIPIAASAHDLARTASILITILPGATETRSAMVGEQRLVDEMQPGSCWLDMTSNDPRVVVAIVERATTRGVQSVGAPMAGGPEAAADGSLGFFVGGSTDAVARVMPLLTAIGSPNQITVLGPEVTAGYTAKLMANTLWFGQAIAVTEMLLLGKASGLDLRTLRDALESSAGGSAFISRHLDSLLAGDYLDTFGIDRVVDELDIITGLADQLAVPHGSMTVTAELHREALRHFGPIEGELLAAKLLEHRSQTTLRA